MLRFVDVVAEVGCRRFSVHARKAWLKGLSPKENRTIPPLRYEEVYRLKRERPELFIEINGGIRTLEEALEHLKHVDAVMIGRAAYDNPWIFAKADSLIFGETDPLETREEALEAFLPYAESHCSAGGRLHHMTRHLHHLFHSCPGSRHWKRHLSGIGSRSDARASELLEALPREG